MFKSLEQDCGIEIHRREPNDGVNKTSNSDINELDSAEALFMRRLCDSIRAFHRPTNQEKRPWKPTTLRFRKSRAF